MRITSAVTGWSVQPSSTSGTRSGQAFSSARRPRARQADRVGMALHGGVGGDHQHVARSRGASSRFGARLNDAENRDRHGVLDGVEGQRAGGVAGDDEELGALLAHQELRAFGGVAGDGAARLGAVGQARRVAEKGKARLRQPLQ